MTTDTTGEREWNGAGETWGVSPDANGYRLPTEAEYEYLCRAGTVTMYSFGDDAALLSRYAVIGVNDPAVVASRSPNGWGLFDMHGNMAEWCYDYREDLEHRGDYVALLLSFRSHDAF